MLNHWIKSDVPAFARTTRGLVFVSLPEIDLPGLVPNPSVGRFIFLNPGRPVNEADDIGAIGSPTLVVQADTTRNEAMAAGIGLQTITDGLDPEMGNFTHALNSSIDTFLQALNGPATDVPDHTQAIAILPDNYITQKLEYDSTLKRLRVYANTALCDSRSLDLSAATDPRLVAFIGSQSDNTTIVHGQGYDARFKNMYAMRSNYLNFFGLPADGSIAVSINGAAEITVNLDGNGDGVLDFAGQVFPCVVKTRIFSLANLAGNIRGRVTILDCFGGDTIGSTRVKLEAQPFTPKSLDHLVGWFDGADLGALASQVASWPDKSGRGFDLGFTVGKPIVGTNTEGKKVALFDGSGQVLFNDAIALALRTQGSFTVCVALGWTNGNRTKGLLSLAKDGSQGFNLSVDGAGNERFLVADNVTTVSEMTTWPFGGDDPRIHTLFFEIDGIRKTCRIWAYDGPPAPTDGELSEAVILNGDACKWPTETPTFALGSFYCDAAGVGSALYGSGQIAAVVLVAKVLRDNDRAALIQYIESKYHH